MKCLVTGGAGFIGSHLIDELLAKGWRVRAVDLFSPYYDPAQKEDNVAGFADRVTVRREDLLTVDLSALLEDIEVVFHQAAQPGVRASWEAFGSYVDANLRVTHRLLEAAREAGVTRFVYASSSSVYGDRHTYPTVESDLPAPVSPYGVTKLAAEHLCSVYAANWDVHTVSLRYFTVFGPRQRPDMAMHRLIESALGGTAFPLYGSGDQIRDFTYVSDVVAANLAAATADVAPGSVVNVAGGGSTTLREVIDMVEEFTGTAVPLDRRGEQPGDVFRTGGSGDLAKRLLGWTPEVPVPDGLRRQVEWHLERRGLSG